MKAHGGQENKAHQVLVLIVFGAPGYLSIFHQGAKLLEFFTGR